MEKLRAMNKPIFSVILNSDTAEGLKAQVKALYLTMFSRGEEANDDSDEANDAADATSNTEEAPTAPKKRMGRPPRAAAIEPAAERIQKMRAAAIVEPIAPIESAPISLDVFKQEVKEKLIDQPAAKIYTRDDLVNALTNLSAKSGIDSVREVLSSFSVRKASEIDVKMYAEVIKACESK